MMACDYCENQKVLPILNQSNQYKYLAIDATGMLCLVNDYTVTRELAQANYCFHCGEKLGGDAS